MTTTYPESELSEVRAHIDSMLEVFSVAGRVPKTLDESGTGLVPVHV
ncbi:hypothetical protein [Mycobacterium cookii]|nr:hypothetical protein [Mycobacterium cookii]MCV7330093.1 hypothetical protein [Mycobacterium cookii]